MKLTEESRSGGIIHLACADDVTLCDLRLADNPLEQLLGKDCYRHKVMLNLQKASFIDSAGIGWLVVCHKRFRDAGGCLVLHSIPPMINHVIQVLRLNDVFNLADDEAQALGKLA